MDRLINSEIPQLRASKTDDGKMVIKGYAAVFNSDSRVLRTKTGQSFIERILPGAFKTELADKQREIRATVLHDQLKVLGRRTKGTVTLAEDEVGLRAEIELPDTTLGRDAFAMVERGDFDKMSFGFDGMDADTSKGTDGIWKRTIKTIKGFKEITICDDRAAYPDTSLSLRMAEDAIIQESMTPEQRALVAIEDNSLAYSCGYLNDRAMSLVSAIDSVMSSCERTLQQTAVLTPADLRAVDAAANALKDLRRRVAPALVSLDSVGADEEDDEEDDAGDGPEVPAADGQRAIMALAESGFASPEKLRGVAKLIVRTFAKLEAQKPATTKAA